MPKVVEATLNPDGTIELHGHLDPAKAPRRALLVILDEAPMASSGSTVDLRHDWLQAPGGGEREIALARSAQRASWSSMNQRPASAPSRYHVLRRLGRGGMGTTFLARDEMTGLPVCLKRLHEDVDRAVLVQEAEALRRLQHPGVVALRELSEFEGQTALVMDYVEGPTLTDYLDAHPARSARLVMTLALRIFEALAHAHAEDVLHCDLKPSNVIIDERNRLALQPRIVDFGLSVVKHQDADGNVTAVGRLAGTPLYMPPEQVEGEVLTPACDVYPVGQMFWEMITGRPAFEGVNVFSIIARKLNSAAGLSLDADVRGVPAEVGALIERCTRRDPAERPSASEAVAVLRAHCSSLPPGSQLAPVNMTLREGLRLPSMPAQPGAVALSTAHRLSGPPPGWSNSVGYVADASPHVRCEFSLTSSGINATALASPTIALSREFGDEGAFSTLMQRIPAEHLAGQRVRFQAAARVKAGRGWAGLWLRGDGDDGMLFFDNMKDRKLPQGREFQHAYIDIHAPEGLRWLLFGVLIAGEGRVEIQRPQLQVWREEQWHDLSLHRIH